MPSPAAKYLMPARLAVRQRLAFPAEFLAPLITVGLLLFVQNRIWVTAFTGKDLIEGYRQVQLSWYVLFTESIYFSAQGYFNSFSGEIKDGQIAYILGRPCSVLWYTVAQRMGTGLMNLATTGLAGGILMTLIAGPWPLESPLQVLFFVPSLLLGMTLQILFQTLVALTAFWMEENSAVYWIWSKFLLVFGTLLPLELLPASWQPWARLTPFPWILWAPARLGVRWSGIPDALFLVGVQLLVLVLVCLVLELVYRRALARVSHNGG